MRNSSDDDDDIFIQDEEEGRKRIAQKDHEINIKGCYDVGYHGGLVGGLERKEEEIMLAALRKGFEQAKSFYGEVYSNIAQEVLSKWSQK